MSWVAPAIAAGAAIGTSLLSSAFGVKENRENRRWQTNMANSAHQREMEDLKKAGINPMYSGKLGGSATPPGGAAQIQDPGPSAVNSARAAMDRDVQAATILDINSATKLKQATTADLDAQRAGRVSLQIAELTEKSNNVTLSDANRRKIDAEIRNLKTSEMLIKAQVGQTRAMTTNLGADSKKKLLVGDIYEETTSAYKKAKEHGGKLWNDLKSNFGETLQKQEQKRRKKGNYYWEPELKDREGRW